MEEETAASLRESKRRRTHNEDEDEEEKEEAGASSSMVLYASPLKIVAPPGIEAPSPSSVKNDRPSGARNLPDFLPFLRVLRGHNWMPRRAKCSAIRDYPEGCRPRQKHKREPLMAPAPVSPVTSVPCFDKLELVKAKSGQASAKAGLITPKSGLGIPKSGLVSPKSAPVPRNYGARFSKPRSPVSSSRLRHNKRLDSVRQSPTSCIVKKMASTVANIDPVEARKTVTDMLRLYDGVRRNLLQMEDLLKGNRPDLNAGAIINNHGRSHNRSSKCVGHFPGVEVGDIFYFRMELSVIGMHGPIQSGIDYLNSKDTQYDFPVAVSIISSGGYEAEDTGDVLVYTGQGGKVAGDAKKNEDQKLERGNLAMEGSYKSNLPVRVVRGVKDPNSPSGKTYTYDGLYMVDSFWSEKGKTGFEEFKFKMLRMPNQPELGSAMLKLSNQLKYNASSYKGVLLRDITGGKEATPVCVVNTVDKELVAPFNYINTTEYPAESLEQLGQLEGCDCDGMCNSSKPCPCLKRNYNVVPYLANGVLVRERSVIYECGENCSCSNSCCNRATQRSPKVHFEVFRTGDKQWCLRSQDVIPAGTFVCEYVGKLVKDQNSISKREYILDMGTIPNKVPRWGDVSVIITELKSRAAAINSLPRPSFIVDASESGNLARFINHSLSPNLLVQCVLRNEHGHTCPHLMLFAVDNIPPFRELTIDYGSNCHSSES